MAEARDQQLGHTKVDLRIHFPAVIPRFVAPAATGRHDVSSACTSLYTKRRDRLVPRLPGRLHAPDGAGGNPDRKRVVEGERVSVRVDLGGCRSIKKNKKRKITGSNIDEGVNEYIQR